MPKTLDLEKFITGFERFQQQYYAEDTDLIGDLVQGQHPRSLLIGCCDSRVDPGHLMGAEPGDMFIQRNVGNRVPPYHEHEAGHHGVSAAIQFAVENLKVERIIVLGHAQCGGIRALMEGRECRHGEFDYVTGWMQIAEPAKKSTLARFGGSPREVLYRACEQASILNSMNNLSTFPWVKRAVKSGELSLHGWFFDLAAGELLAYSDRAGQFLPVVCSIKNERHASHEPLAQR